MSDASSNFRLFATDIEDAIAGDAESAALFKQVWEAIDPERRPLLVYNTGRSVGEAMCLMLEGRIPEAEFVIGAIGTEVFDPIDVCVSNSFSQHIAAGWHAGTVQRIVEDIPGVRRQPGEFLNAHKLSWHWHRASAADVVRLESRLKDAGLEVSVLYTSGVFLDVIPARAGKGNALSWLCDRIGIEGKSVLVAGAGGNNGSMFRLPGARGIVVGNASRELFTAASACRPFLASAASARGVMAGLRHFGVLTGADAAVIPSGASR